MKNCKQFIILILFFLSWSCQKSTTNQQLITDKKVIIVHSYHAEVGGVISKNQNLVRILNENKIEYEFIYMDTKRNPYEEFARNAAIKARDRILKVEPDLIITFDDNAFKYLIMPYFRDSIYPVIFGGIEWDVSVYNAPYSNTTGILSVELVEQLLEYLKKYAKGTETAWLAFRNTTSEQVYRAYNEILQLDISPFYVENFEDWKKTFLEIQKNYNILLLNGSLNDMSDWDDDAARVFILDNIRIPVGTVNNLEKMTVVQLSRHGYEIGEWVGRTALKILDGGKVSQIPVTRTTEGVLHLNLDLAEKLDIEFSPELLKIAEIVTIKE